MNGSQMNLINYQIRYQSQNSSPKQEQITLQENLERLSYLIGKKEQKQSDFRQQYFEQQQTGVKKVYVNLKGFTKTPQSGQASKQMSLRSQQQTPQTSTPLTTHDQNATATKKPFLTHQNMNIYNKYARRSDTTQIDTFLQSERGGSLIQLNRSQKRTYNSWVGLGVIERNKQFLEKKQQKINKMKEDKEQKEISKCTFTPQFFNQIKVDKQSRMSVNKSYTDLYKMKQLSNSKSQLY